MNLIQSIATLLLVFSLARASGRERELINDAHFQRGFILWKTEPGQHVCYGTLAGPNAKDEPVWGLSQWDSRFPLNPANQKALPGDVLLCENPAKSIVFGSVEKGSVDLTLAANSDIEYGPQIRKAGTPWVHLIVEQEFKSPAFLEKLSAATLHLEARLVRSRNPRETEQSPGIHAAQFQLFFTVQNRNRQSPGFGDLLWFGIPIYDNRDRFAPEFKSQDFGGTGKFIFTPGARTFSPESTHDGQWVHIEKDLLPLMHQALQTAWTKGFLQGSKIPADYAIGGMNMGWELPGSFDVSMEIRALSLSLSE
ncbi:MAG: hypothetical protein JWL59_4498 [Chthoniobacteraceae bacterium]|nr:hypothetical protein [Chthoniobacteraceae bacterium]